MKQEIGTQEGSAGRLCEELSGEEGTGSLSCLPEGARAVPGQADRKGKERIKEMIVFKSVSHCDCAAGVDNVLLMN